MRNENLNDNDGENIFYKVLMKEVLGCRNCDADDIKELLNNDEMVEITELIIVKMIEDDKECNDTEENYSLPLEINIKKVLHL